MSTKVSIFSERNSDDNKTFADYKELLASLPTLKWEPNKTGTANKKFQGTATVENIDFLTELLNRLKVSAITTYSDNGIILVLIDDLDEDEDNV